MKIIEIISEGGKVDQPVYVIGDSIGVGIQNAGGVDGDTKGGINTRQVLDKVQKFVDSGKAKGTLVILSSGASNSTYERKNGSKQELDIAPVVQQLRLLKQAGAIPVLVGSASGASAWITNKYGEYRVNFSSEQVNEKLSAAAKEANVKFLGPLEDYDPKIGVEKGGDGIHPFNGYAKLFKAATSGGSGAMVSPLGDKEDNKNSGSSSFELDVPDSRTGPAVADIQKALEALGFNVGPMGVDGIRGPYTSSAVKKFQASVGLTTDGDPGPNTVAALTKVLASHPEIKLTKSSDADVKIKGGSVEYSGKIGKGAGATGSAKSAVSFFMGKGWSPAQAAGIVGNLQAESGANLNTSAVGDGGLAYGIAQWHPDRQARFKQVYGKDIHGSSLDDQLEFVHWELTHTEANAGNRIKGCDTPQAAAATMDQYYERSNGAARGQRVGNAIALMPNNSTAVA